MIVSMSYFMPPRIFRVNVISSVVPSLYSRFSWLIVSVFISGSLVGSRVVVTYLVVIVLIPFLVLELDVSVVVLDGVFAFLIGGGGEAPKNAACDAMAVSFCDRRVACYKQNLNAICCSLGQEKQTVKDFVQAVASVIVFLSWSAHNGNRASKTGSFSCPIKTKEKRWEPHS